MTDDNINTDLLLKRQLVWDIVPCKQVQEMMPKMGLIPASESGNNREHKDSHKRLNNLGLIEEHVVRTAVLAGEVVGRAILENQGIEVSGLDDPQLQQYMKAVQAGVVGSISVLIDGGVLGINLGALQ